MEIWIIDEVTAGLTRLYALRLRNYPPADMIQKTAEEWSLSVRRYIGQPIAKLDVPRIRSAFDALIDQSEFWPAPATLLKAMPSRPIRYALPVPNINKEGQERGKAILRDILKSISDQQGV